jgi:hypothetical protein
MPEAGATPIGAKPANCLGKLRSEEAERAVDSYGDLGLGAEICIALEEVAERLEPPA